MNMFSKLNSKMELEMFIIKQMVISAPTLSMFCIQMNHLRKVITKVAPSCDSQLSWCMITGFFDAF